MHNGGCGGGKATACCCCCCCMGTAGRIDAACAPAASGRACQLPCGCCCACGGTGCWCGGWWLGAPRVPAGAGGCGAMDGRMHGAAGCRTCGTCTFGRKPIGRPGAACDVAAAAGMAAAGPTIATASGADDGLGWAASAVAQPCDVLPACCPGAAAALHAAGHCSRLLLNCSC